MTVKSCVGKRPRPWGTFTATPASLVTTRNPTPASRSLNRNNRFLLLAVCGLLSAMASGADFPRGFFVEDLRRQPPVPAFFNLETKKVESFSFRQSYSDFIDMTWVHEKGQI